MNQAAVQHYRSDEIDPLFLRAARDLLAVYIRPGRILNVGVGYGVWDHLLAQQSDESISIDVSEELIAWFRAKYPHITYVVSDVFAYRPDKPFDTIIGSHILEHVDDPIGLLVLWKSWLVPKGRLLIAVPNAHSVHRQIGVRMGLLKHVTELNASDLNIGHKRVYTADSFHKDLAASGLRVIRSGGVTCKPLSNGQLAAMPPAYVEACCGLTDEVSDLAGQLYAVLEA